jgi:hypothetical protein
MDSDDFAFKLDAWILEFENDVMAHFSAGSPSDGLAAYQAWCEKVESGLQEFEPQLAAAFTSSLSAARRRESQQEFTPRAGFLRDHGRRSIGFLKRLRRGPASSGSAG